MVARSAPPAKPVFAIHQQLGQIPNRPGPDHTREVSPQRGFRHCTVWPDNTLSRGTRQRHSRFLRHSGTQETVSPVRWSVTM